jgi:hypothetical protein
MTDTSNLSRHRAFRIKETATHKFPIGAYVLHKVGVLSRKEAFRVTRLLPDEGAGFQYRIKSELEGFERVAMESSLTWGGSGQEMSFVRA